MDLVARVEQEILSGLPRVGMAVSTPLCSRPPGVKPKDVWRIGSRWHRRHCPGSFGAFSARALGLTALPIRRQGWLRNDRFLLVLHKGFIILGLRAPGVTLV